MDTILQALVMGIVQGLNDPTTVDYTKTRWVSPRATLVDIKGDQSVWGMYFSGGNCLDGDSDAFHFLGQPFGDGTDVVAVRRGGGDGDLAAESPACFVEVRLVAAQCSGAGCFEPSRATAHHQHVEGVFL